MKGNPMQMYPSDGMSLWAVSGRHWMMDHPQRAAPTPAQQTEYEQARKQLPMQVEGGVAVIDILGPMERRPSMFGWSFGFASTESIRAALSNAMGDADVAAIVLRIDSPGGTVDGLAELGDAVWAARQAGTKPILAQAEGMVASAAYYVASQAESISAGRMDLVGSIGTRLVLWDMAKAFDQAGIEVVVLDSGEFKSAGEPGTEITDEQTDYLQGIVDAYQADFISVVARGRGVTASAVKDMSGGGKVYIASEAKERGLLDEIAGIGDTLAGLQQTSARQSRSRRTRSELALLAE